RLLISGLLTVAIIGGFYFLLYNPLTARRAQLNTTLQQRVIRLNEMKQIAAQREALGQGFAARQPSIGASEAKAAPGGRRGRGRPAAPLGRDSSRRERRRPRRRRRTASSGWNSGLRGRTIRC